MPIETECPSGHRLKIPEKLRGHSIACPICDARFFVEAENPESPEAKEKAAMYSNETPLDSLTSQHPQIETQRDALTDLVEKVLPESTEDTVSNVVAEGASGMTIDEDFSAEQLEMFDVVGTETNSPAWIVIDTENETKPNSHRKANTSGTSKNYVLSIMSVTLAIVCAVPSFVQHESAARLGGVPDAWTYCVMLGCVVQLGIAAFSLLVPDWSTHWIAAITTTGLAAVYALALAMTTFAGQHHQLVRELGLPDEVFRKQAQPWCFLVMSMALILAYFFGRSSARWRMHERMLGRV